MMGEKSSLVVGLCSLNGWRTGRIMPKGAYLSACTPTTPCTSTPKMDHEIMQLVYLVNGATKVLSASLSLKLLL